jgi:integrase
VTADEAYGKDATFRAWLQRRHIGYVLAVPCSQKIPTEGGSARADALAARAPLSAWRRRSCGDGAKGPRLYDWALASTMLDAGVSLRDVQIAARHADPRTTMRYDRARKNLDRHPNYILAAYMASGT